MDIVNMANKKRILKGNSDFEYMVVNNAYFVDKTLFLKEFQDNDDHVLLIPARAGLGRR